ncbi:hypothetical protein ACW9KT_02845 [Hymenobacter sp. HD11105]
MEELLAGYALNDGKICSIRLEVEYSSVTNSAVRQASVHLLIRKKATNGKWEPCLLQIQLIGIQKLVINEEFDSTYYSDVVFKKIENDMWYLSLDPYGNSGEPQEKDNLVIVAESVKIEEEILQDRF